jgi:hypothetical protein
VKPPVLASWLLSRVLPDEDRDGILGEFEEMLRREPPRSTSIGM